VRDPIGKPADYPPLLHHPPIHPVIGERTAIVRGRRRERERERELAAVMSAIMSAIAVIERMSAKDYTAAVLIRVVVEMSWITAVAILQEALLERQLANVAVDETATLRVSEVAVQRGIDVTRGNRNGPRMLLEEDREGRENGKDSARETKIARPRRWLRKRR